VCSPQRVRLLGFHAAEPLSCIVLSRPAIERVQHYHAHLQRKCNLANSSICPSKLLMVMVVCITDGTQVMDREQALSCLLSNESTVGNIAKAAAAYGLLCAALPSRVASPVPDSNSCGITAKLARCTSNVLHE
jgi:hypothetical protein